MRRRHLAVACSQLSGAAPAPAERPLQPILEKVAASIGVGGFVTAEIRDGKVTYQIAGSPAPHEGIAPERIVFEIGSITKVFTALVLAHAVNEGRCSLDDPIGKFLPPTVKMQPEVAAITLGQLASHTSGLPCLPGNFAPANPSNPYADYTVERLYEFLAQASLSKPGPHPFDYSNIGFGLLGHLLERIYGKGFGELVTEKITDPLGMSDTTIQLSADQEDRFAIPHSGKDTVAPWDSGVVPGAGALRSTAADMATFTSALLSGSDTPLAAAWRLASQPRTPAVNGQQLGLALFIGERSGATSYSHGGGTGGSRAHIEITPEKGRALIVFLNNDAVEPDELVEAAFNPPKPPPTGREEVEIDSVALKEYTGVYAIDARVRFSVILDDSAHLRIRFTGQSFLSAFYSGNDRFFLKVVAAEFQFGRDPEGRMNALTLHQNGREVPAKRTKVDPPKVLFLPAGKIAEFAGRFELAPGMIFDVTPRADTLFVKLTGQQAHPVFNEREDYFVYDVVEAALTFERDKDGVVTGLILHQNGANQKAKKLP